MSRRPVATDARSAIEYLLGCDLGLAHQLTIAGLPPLVIPGFHDVRDLEVDGIELEGFLPDAEQSYLRSTGEAEGALGTARSRARRSRVELVRPPSRFAPIHGPPRRLHGPPRMDWQTLWRLRRLFRAVFADPARDDDDEERALLQLRDGLARRIERWVRRRGSSSGASRLEDLAALIREHQRVERVEQQLVHEYEDVAAVLAATTPPHGGELLEEIVETKSMRATNAAIVQAIEELRLRPLDAALIAAIEAPSIRRARAKLTNYFATPSTTLTAWTSIFAKRRRAGASTAPARGAHQRTSARSAASVMRESAATPSRPSRKKPARTNGPPSRG